MTVFNRLAGAFLAVLALSSSVVVADELDAKSTKPAGVLMLVNEVTGKMESFKVDSLDESVKTQDLTQAELDALVKKIAVKENKIGEAAIKKSSDELDGKKATEACWGGCWGWGWGYAGGCFGYGGCCYRPYYSFGCGGGCGYYGGYRGYWFW